MFGEFKPAFEKATGLPLSMHPPAEERACDLPQKKPAGPASFCARLARTSRACTACFALQQRLEEEAKLQPKTLKCLAGLCETAVPVRVGERLVAFIQTGGVLVETPNRRQCDEVARELLRLGTPIDLKKFDDDYHAARVLVPEQYESMVRLLAIFADQLGACGSQLALRQSAPETPAVSRARQIIDADFREELSLGAVARQVNVSVGYFGTQFKKDTGFNFVDYVARRRVGEARTMLQNPKFRISEAAFEVGFQSLSQFNRSFHRIAGMSPRAYRASLGHAA